VGQDISELDKLRTESESVAKELRQFIETANAPIFGIDADGNVNEWNQTAEKITGFTKDEVLGKDLVETYITEDYRKAVKEVLDNALKGKETANYEFPLFTKGGKRVMVLLNSSTRRNVEGQIVGVLGVGQDISELDNYRTNMEKLVHNKTQELSHALTESETSGENLNNILKSIGDGVIVTDLEHNITLINSPAEKIFKIKTGDAVGHPLSFALKNPGLETQFANALKKHLTGSFFEFEIKQSTGSKSMFIRCNMSTVIGMTKEKTGTITIIRDITFDREVDRMKMEFLSTAAHELRSPLTSIRGFSELMQSRNDFSFEQRKRYLGFIKTRADGLTSIINDLLDVSRIEAGKGFVLNRVDCFAGESIKKIIGDYSNYHKHHKFEMVTPKKDTLFFVDKVKMFQVLDNLLNNAVKYSPEGGTISVKGIIKKNNYIITIKDQGIGMTKKQLSNIYDKFYRADSSNTAVEGTGLGMYIAKSIVEAHGGTISIESKVNVGTTVSLVLPEKQEVNLI